MLEYIAFQRLVFPGNQAMFSKFLVFVLQHAS